MSISARRQHEFLGWFNCSNLNFNMFLGYIEASLARVVVGTAFRKPAKIGKRLVRAPPFSIRRL